MSNINIPPNEYRNENFVDAEDSPPLPSNPEITNRTSQTEFNISSYENERRCLFRVAFIFTLLIIFALYLGLGYWIFTQSTGYHIHSNMWHIAVILAIPPTTLLFLLLKVLAKQPEKESVNAYPVSEFFGQLINVLKEWVSLKK